jgi:hypothetical protein
MDIPVPVAGAVDLGGAPFIFTCTSLLVVMSRHWHDTYWYHRTNAQQAEGEFRFGIASTVPGTKLSTVQY